MELTKEQIQQIEYYLNTKDVRYIDIRYEVLDHMVSDIEKQMQEEIGFEEAFYNVKLKWRKSLDSTFSYFTGMQYQRPKLIIDKSKSLIKKLWFFWLIVFLVIPLSISFLNIPDINFSNPSTPKTIFKVIAVVTFFPLLFWYIDMLRDKQKSTYLFLYEKQIASYVVVNLFLFFNLFKSDNFIKSPNFGYSLLLIVGLYFGFTFYKKHKQAVTRLKHN